MLNVSTILPLHLLATLSQLVSEPFSFYYLSHRSSSSSSRSRTPFLGKSVAPSPLSRWRILSARRSARTSAPRYPSSETQRKGCNSPTWAREIRAVGFTRCRCPSRRAGRSPIQIPDPYGEKKHHHHNDHETHNPKHEEEDLYDDKPLE
jgi:hypothetical protein